MTGAFQALFDFVVICSRNAWLLLETKMRIALDEIQL
jgi:hypothetical protein